MPSILGRHALSSGSFAGLGATRNVHHGLLVSQRRQAGHVARLSAVSVEREFPNLLHGRREGA